jgi:hypothetical protein
VTTSPSRQRFTLGYLWWLVVLMMVVVFIMIVIWCSIFVIVRVVAVDHVGRNEAVQNA